MTNTTYLAIRQGEGVTLNRCLAGIRNDALHLHGKEKEDLFSALKDWREYCDIYGLHERKAKVEQEILEYYFNKNF